MFIKDTVYELLEQQKILEERLVEWVKLLGLYFISFGINASCLSNMKLFFFHLCS